VQLKAEPQQAKLEPFDVSSVNLLPKMDLQHWMPISVINPAGTKELTTDSQLSCSMHMKANAVL